MGIFLTFAHFAIFARDYFFTTEHTENTEVGGRRSEVGGRKTEDGGQRSELLSCWVVRLLGC